MPEKQKKYVSGWAGKVPQYIDLSDLETHRVMFLDDGTEVKIPGGKSDFNVSFLAKEWNGEEEVWEPNTLTLSAKKALRNLLKIQEETGALKGRVFDITRSGEGMKTVYEFAEVSAETLEASGQDE